MRPRVQTTGLLCLFQKSKIMGRHSKAGSTRPNFRHQNNRAFKGPHQKKNWNEQYKSNSKGNERYPQAPRTTLREDQVGITEYINPTAAGFTAVIKSRYSDFHVNEIDLNDEVLILNDLNIPQGEEDAPLDDAEMAKVREQLKDVISEESWEEIKTLAECSQSAKKAEPIEIVINELDKDERTKIHALLKQLYAGKLVSSTVSLDIDGNQKKILRVAKPKGKAVEKRRKWTFPGEYVNFLVYKENLDTSEVASHLAMNFSMAPSKVNYCGTKDKRAITTQKFCIKRRTPSDIVAALRGIRNVKIGNFSFSQNVLKLGDLHGNRFRIALRHIDAEEKLIERALLQLRERGFINYYGLQRFGNCVDVPTYEIGVALMKADYKKACELILKPRNSDPPFLREMRETWWKNRDSKAAAAMFRSDRFIEKKLLDGLARYGENDFSTALRKLPRNLLLLYPHAFQSLVFNRIASRRIKEYGLKIMPGDLVYRNKTDIDDEDPQIENTENETIEDNEENTSDCDEISKDVSNPPAPNESADETKIESEFKQKVRALTEEDIATGKYTIHEIVLPLPGYDIKYPENVLDEWYKEILQEFDLTSEALNHNVKTFKMAGAYRKLVVLPKNLTWEFRHYDQDDAQLIWSDLDVLRKTNAERSLHPKNEGIQRALLLDFCLPTSCYATMFLRELLKADTSSSNQASLETEAKGQQQKQSVTVETDANDEQQTTTDVAEGCNNRKRSIDTSQSDETEPLSKITCNPEVSD